jgi:hypothetical protein
VSPCTTSVLPPTLWVWADSVVSFGLVVGIGVYTGGAPSEGLLLSSSGSGL